MAISFGYRFLVSLRRICYQLKLLTSTSVKVPVIIIGNLSVGGTGKTPLTIWMVSFLRKLGYQPGVISRGYSGQLSAQNKISLLPKDADPLLFGDEAVLIASRTDCPVVIGKSRLACAQHLLSVSDCDIIISDDGLQHLALNRDIEILVIDGMRQFGNRQCLPAGPLREPVSRLNTVDFVVSNGSRRANAFQMDLVGNTLKNLQSKEQRQPLSFLKNKPFHVVTAIGNPQRFFRLLERAGLVFDRRIFPDHYHYNADDLKFDDNFPIVMTEKDAVKCYHLANSNTWMLPVNAQLDSSFQQQLKQLLEQKYGRHKIA